MDAPDVLALAERERWMWSNTQVNETISRLWRAYQHGAEVELTPDLLRAAMVTLADGVRRMERDFWADAHAA